MRLEVMKGIWNYIRGYRKVRVIAENSGQLFVSDEKGRIGYLSGKVFSEQMNGEEFWALRTGKKVEYTVSPGSYSADDSAFLIWHQREKGRWLVRLKKRKKFAFLYSNRHYQITNMVAVNYEGTEPMLCFYVQH